MSDAQLEQLLGRSLSDDQRSRFYDIERQAHSEASRNMMMRPLSSGTTPSQKTVSRPETDAGPNTLDEGNS